MKSAPPHLSPKGGACVFLFVFEHLFKTVFICQDLWMPAVGAAQVHNNLMDADHADGTGLPSSYIVIRYDTGNKRYQICGSSSGISDTGQEVTLDIDSSANNVSVIKWIGERIILSEKNKL